MPTDPSKPSKANADKIKAMEKKTPAKKGTSAAAKNALKRGASPEKAAKVAEKFEANRKGK